VKPPASRLLLNNYPHQAEFPLRFADVDPLWHLNNVRIVELYQEGRIQFSTALAGHTDMLKSSDMRLLVVRQSVDYLAEVKWPGHVTIGVGVAGIGNSSFTLALGMFQHGSCVGISDAVMVYAGVKQTKALPAAMRELLSRTKFKDAEVDDA
jgi:acyl-CoA thioester hydrolase